MLPYIIRVVYRKTLQCNWSVARYRLKRFCNKPSTIIIDLLMLIYNEASAQVLHKLIIAILNFVEWPMLRTIHCVVPLFKRKSVFHTENYRGIHLTSQISKVAERVIAFSVCTAAYKHWSIWTELIHTYFRTLSTRRNGAVSINLDFLVWNQGTNRCILFRRFRRVW